MRLSNCIYFALAAVLLVVPAGLFGSTTTCLPAAPTALSKTWNFPREATQLLNKIQYQAYQTKEDALGMSTRSRFNQDSWRFMSYHLSRVRAHVNAMGEELCRLQVIRRATLPWQQHEIDRIAPIVREMAARTRNAIKSLQGDQHAYWATNLPNDWSYISAEASNINKSVDNQIEFAKLRKLTMPSSSSTTSSGM
jgi:hypothetical protein